MAMENAVWLPPMSGSRGGLKAAFEKKVIPYKDGRVLENDLEDLEIPSEVKSEIYISDGCGELPHQ